MTYSMSSAVVIELRLNLRLPWASSGVLPIAINTWDGSKDPEEHAEPVETATPFKSSEMTKPSPSA